MRRRFSLCWRKVCKAIEGMSLWPDRYAWIVILVVVLACILATMWAVAKLGWIYTQSKPWTR